MATESHPTDPAGPKPPSFGFGQIVVALVLLIILLLLGQSMVRHRFFRGGRYHQNGSVGQ
jgi:hypothetical protein